MSVTEILEQVDQLSPADKARVIATLNVDSQTVSSMSTNEKEENVLQAMLQKEMIKSIPKYRTSPRKSRPVPIQGRPLSETITEERR